MPIAFTLNDAEKAFLGRQARRSIEAALAGASEPKAPEPPKEIDCQNSPLRRPLGAFVTLNLHHRLRGCIGSIVGREPLYQNVWGMARSAAFSDPRFPPLTLAEWPKVHMDISVLDELGPCPDPDAVEVGRHGLVLQYQGYSGVFLPQVPVEQGWDRLAYLDNLCRKAGLPPGSWKLPGARLLWYEALVFPA